MAKAKGLYANIHAKRARIKAGKKKKDKIKSEELRKNFRRYFTNQ